MVHHFGTERPSVDQYEELVAAADEEYEGSLLDECQMRWTGYHIVLYTADRPTHLGVFGFSGD